MSYQVARIMPSSASCLCGSTPHQRGIIAISIIGEAWLAPAWRSCVICRRPVEAVFSRRFGDSEMTSAAATCGCSACSANVSVASNAALCSHQRQPPLKRHLCIAAPVARLAAKKHHHRRAREKRRGKWRAAHQRRGFSIGRRESHRVRLLSLASREIFIARALLSQYRPAGYKRTSPSEASSIIRVRKSRSIGAEKEAMPH